MFEFKSIFIFAGKCIFIYLLLLVASNYLGIGEKYVTIVRNIGNTLYEQVGKTGIVQFQKNKHKQFDTKIRVTNAKIKKRGWYEARSHLWNIAYLPTVLLVSLILATSFTTIQKKIQTLLFGLGFITVFIFCILRLRINFLFNEGERGVGQFEPSFFSHIVDFIDKKMMFGNISVLMAVSVFIWLLVSFRKSDYERFMKGLSKE